MRLKSAYFVLSGVMAHVFVIAAIILLAKHFDLSPRQFIFRLAEKSGIESSMLKSWVINREFIEQHTDYPFIPDVIDTSPKFVKQIKLLSETYLDDRAFSAQELKHYDPCLFSGSMWDTACYLLRKNPAFEQPLIAQMISFELQTPNAAGHHGNGWQLAFMYDALKARLPLTDIQRQKINHTLEKSLFHYLLLLNDNSASLWHGRASLASQLWLVVMALDHVTDQQLADTAPHLYSLIEALEFSEAWPGGYNYWINNRGYTVSLALSSYLQGTQPDVWHDRILKVLHKIGLWHIYATRPDQQIEPLGDEGPRIDLKDETRRVIDIVAQATGQKTLAEFSTQLEQLHGRESYYRGYRWGYSLFNGRQFKQNDAGHIQQLPNMAMFGFPYFGQTYIHQSWQENETFISFRSGDSFSHHGHYDSGHLSLFKGSPLLVNSSVYHGFNQENRLDYSIRTIAKNAIVFTGTEDNEIDGGQRVIMPTGSAILSPSHWLENRNKGLHLAGGKIVQHHANNAYSYIKADLSGAYNSSWYDSTGGQGDVKTVVRELVYWFDTDVLVVKDTIETLDEAIQPRIVYHTKQRPHVSDLQTISGTRENGISTTSARELFIQNGEGRLVTEVFGNIDQVTLIGGKDHQFYLPATSSNKVEGVPFEAQKNAAQWRFEIAVEKGSKPHSVITIHRPSIASFSSERTVEHRLKNGQYWYQIGQIALVFGEQNENFLTQLPQIIEQVYQCGLDVAQAHNSGCSVINTGDY